MEQTLVTSASLLVKSQMLRAVVSGNQAAVWQSLLAHTQVWPWAVHNANSTPLSHQLQQSAVICTTAAAAAGGAQTARSRQCISTSNGCNSLLSSSSSGRPLPLPHALHPVQPMQRHCWLPQSQQQQRQQRPPCLSTAGSRISNQPYCNHHMSYSSNGGSSSSSSKAAAGDSSRPTGADAAREPAAMASAAAAIQARTLVKNVSQATAQQASHIFKLVQQTSLLQAASLQLASLWQSHSTSLTLLTAAAATAGLYQLTYAAAGSLIDVSSPAVVWGCAAVSAAAVGLLGLWTRAAFVVDAERVFQVAMRKITKHAGLLEVMGTPLAGSPLRIHLITRGSIILTDNLLLQKRAPRIHMLFSLSGPLRSGVVSLEAKRASGNKYAFKSLYVELPDKQLAGAAGTAAASAAAQHASEASRQGKTSNVTVSGASSSGGSDEGGSSKLGIAQTTVATAGQEPARIYIVGSPAADTAQSSSSTSDRKHASATAMQPTAHQLLEQLKQPLVYALQQSITVCQAEDEIEHQLGYLTDPKSDPEQYTLWDRMKQGSAVLAKVVYHGSKAAAEVSAQQVQRMLALVRQRAQAAAEQRKKTGNAAKAQQDAAAAGQAARAGESTVQPAAAQLVAATSTAGIQAVGAAQQAAVKHSGRLPQGAAQTVVAAPEATATAAAAGQQTYPDFAAATPTTVYITADAEQPTTAATGAAGSPRPAATAVAAVQQQPSSGAATGNAAFADFTRSEAAAQVTGDPHASSTKDK